VKRESRAAERLNPIRVIVSKRGKDRQSIEDFSIRHFADPNSFSTKRMPKRTRTALRQKAILHLSEIANMSTFGRDAGSVANQYNVRTLACEGGANAFSAPF